MMRDREQNTPPPSINEDEITAVDEGVIYLHDMEELQLDDEMEYLADPDEEMEMEPPEDHAALVFCKHEKSVFCCDLHPNGKLAVTGGEDDKAFVWSVSNGEIVMDCTGHKDSVVFVGFSFDGVYLATVDMSGLLKVWKCNLDSNSKEAWPVVFEYEFDDLTWGLWHNKARVLICGVVTGDVYVFKIPSGETKVLQGHVKTECGKLFPDGVRLSVGYEDGCVKVWDLKTATVVQQLPTGAHQIRVTAVDTHPDNNVMASISTDGKVVLSTSTTGKVIGQLEAESDLETVAFAPDPQLGYFAIGTLNGAVSIWDLARQMVRHHCSKADNESSTGVTKMVWAKNHLITGCLDGSVRVYEGRSGERSLMLTGHWSEILDMCFNEKEQLILTTSDDSTARIFKYEVNKEND